MHEVAQQAEIENDLLAALPRYEYEHLLPHLEPVPLQHGKILYELHDPVGHAYFPTSGMISLLSTTKDGDSVEVAMVGPEGVFGLPSILRVKRSPYRVRTQIAGGALRIRADALLAEFRRGGELQNLMLCYAHALLSQIAQSVACNLFHPMGRRLARWLLIAHDCAKADAFPLTHEDIAQMLGVSRSGVSGAAGVLQSQGLIRYTRGRIAVLDREGLEAAACECYRVIREELDCFLTA
jgi:CRP-like cAMP-binding protein